MRLYRSLPPRPTIEQVEASKSVVLTSISDQDSKLQQIQNLRKPPDVPDELFDVLQEARKNSVMIQALEQRKEVQFVVDLDAKFRVFDEIIQRASKIVKGEKEEEGEKDLWLEKKEETKEKKEERKEKKSELGAVSSFKAEALPLDQNISRMLDWGPYSFSLLQLPDSEILSRCSTSPAAESDDFVENERRKWKYLVEHPDWKQTFTGRKPRIFERAAEGGWRRHS